MSRIAVTHIWSRWLWPLLLWGLLCEKLSRSRQMPGVSSSPAREGHGWYLSASEKGGDTGQPDRARRKAASDLLCTQPQVCFPRVGKAGIPSRFVCDAWSERALGPPRRGSQGLGKTFPRRRGCPRAGQHGRAEALQAASPAPGFSGTARGGRWGPSVGRRGLELIARAASGIETNKWQRAG